MTTRELAKHQEKIISITRLDYSKINAENLFEWLELFGFERYVRLYYLDPKKKEDKRGSMESTAPEGYYPAMIVPRGYYDRDETLFIISKREYEKIKQAFLKSLEAQTSTA